MSEIHDNFSNSFLPDELTKFFRYEFDGDYEHIKDVIFKHFFIS